MDENKISYIYCFTNLINNKKYIGSTIQNPQRRYKQHLYLASQKDNDKFNYPLYCAIRKYGIENFSFDILTEFTGNYQELLNLEKELIIKNNTVCPFGYNQTSDTTHPLNDLNTYKKISEVKREQAKKVIIFDINQEKILGIYRSIIDCAEATGLDERKIAACCRGERRTTGNVICYWLDNNNDLIIPEYKRDNYKGKKGTTQIQSSSRAVAKIDLITGEEICRYDTIALAARENSCDPSGIAKVCKRIRNKVKGFGWKYV